MFVPDIKVEDVPYILRIIEDCGLSKWTADGIFSELKRADSLRLSIREETLIVGFIIARIITGGELEILNFGILPEYQKQGFGSILWKHLLQKAFNHSVKTIYLEVRVSNDNALRFYRKRGFKVVMTRKNFYINPIENAVLMKLSLLD